MGDRTPKTLCRTWRLEHTMPIQLVPYDPRWVEHFEQARLPLSQALGDYAVDIQHVGSTSIPGISAKPVVDIAVAIEHYPLPDDVLDAVKALGYTYWGEYGIPHRHLFFTREGPVGYNVHINELANDQFQRHLLFRDYLLAHPDAVREYEALKQELAARFDEVGPYADSKSAFVQGIVAKARLGQLEQENTSRD
jgi:GrpB-like predicted nucleotidyltransferase (UPF0157 family)